MALHIIKLCVGASSIEDLAAWQTERIREQKKRGEKPRIFHSTLQTPKRQTELKGGSLYWVIKGIVQVRQKLLGFEDGTKDDGSPCCLILLDRKLVPVRPVPRRAFQGWRYLAQDDAPPDLDAGGGGDFAALPPEMRRALLDLGLI
ncbi:DUF1489 domain-containing protein [uncultured Hyphomicrobium sp.]|uniref:DUF1489 family protein n=1 Tax=uncultured Hyphomicrobium sp. TaxID=194373 RepID=UPI0025D0E7BC|nr:DUF1489 domain-containing protein [uncultured Hyphomicrobium sp.]